MTPAEVETDLMARFSGLRPKASWGERSFFLNPDGVLPNGVYFATIKEADGENDRASALDRPDVWRVNFGVPKSLFQDHFGAVPKRPAKGEAIAGDWDFTTLDTLMPHPIYGWMGWVAVLCPSRATWDQAGPLLDAAYEKAQAGLKKRLK